MIVRGGTYHGKAATFDHRVVEDGTVFGFVVIIGNAVRRVPKVRLPGAW